MGKLLRDEIPIIIEEYGKKPRIRILSKEEFIYELDKQLNEEVAGYQVSKSLEKMADILEILFTLCEARGNTVEELIALREDKRKKRGGYSKRIYWDGILEE